MIDPATASGAILIAAVGTIAAGFMIDATKCTLNYVKQSRHAEEAASHLRFTLKRARESDPHDSVLRLIGEAEDALSRYQTLALASKKSVRKRAKVCRKMRRLDATLCTYLGPPGSASPQM